MANDQPIAALAAAGGIARVDELAVATGLSHRTVRSHARRSGWWCPYPSVVALPGLEATGAEGWARAAVLHAHGRTGHLDRDIAALTRRSALHHLGVTRSAPTRVEVVVPVARCLADQPRLALSRSSHLRPEELTRVRGVDVVVGEALIRDLAAVRDPSRLRADAISLQHAGHLDVGALRGMYERCGRFPGRGSVARVLRDLEAAGRVDSPLELDVRARFARAGVPLDRGQVAVAVDDAVPWPLHLDLGIAVIRFGIEVDSMAHHSAPEDLRRDAERRNRIALVTDDWRILHVTYADLSEERWQAMVERARTVITVQSRRYLGVPWPRPSDLRR